MINEHMGFAVTALDSFASFLNCLKCNHISYTVLSYGLDKYGYKKTAKVEILAPVATIAAAIKNKKFEDFVKPQSGDKTSTLIFFDKGNYY